MPSQLGPNQCWTQNLAVADTVAHSSYSMRQLAAAAAAQSSKLACQLQAWKELNWRPWAAPHFGTGDLVCPGKVHFPSPFFKFTSPSQSTKAHLRGKSQKQTKATKITPRLYPVWITINREVRTTMEIAIFLGIPIESLFNPREVQGPP